MNEHSYDPEIDNDLRTVLVHGERHIVGWEIIAPVGGKHSRHIFRGYCHVMGFDFTASHTSQYTAYAHLRKRMAGKFSAPFMEKRARELQRLAQWNKGDPK